MKGSGYRISRILMLLVPTALLLAQTNSPFDGKWELNVAKSTIKSQPAPKSESITTIDGKTTVEGTDAEGKPFTWAYRPSPGVAVPIEGIENATVDEKLSATTVDDTWKVAGGNTHGHGILMNSGKVLKYTNKGSDGQGHPVDDVYIFEKK